MYIFHCVRKRDYDPTAKFYGEESVKKCGFIHCSDIDTYYLVAPNFKDDYEERILLLINTDKVIPEIKWEDSEGWDFPHIYGLLNTDAVEAILPHIWSEDRVWIPNEELVWFRPNSFRDNYKNFLNEFGKGKHMVLSSSENDKVTSRMMSIVQSDGLFYFQTDKTFRKYTQLVSNPQIALCIDNIQIEGICEKIGHPMDNASFCRLYQECFNGSYERYSALNNERLFVVKPTYVERWLYIAGIPFVETFDVENQIHNLVKYEGV